MLLQLLLLLLLSPLSPSPPLLLLSTSSTLIGLGVGWGRGLSGVVGICPNPVVDWYTTSIFKIEIGNVLSRKSKGWFFNSNSSQSTKTTHWLFSNFQILIQLYNDPLYTATISFKTDFVQLLNWNITLQWEESFALILAILDWAWIWVPFK